MMNFNNVLINVNDEKRSAAFASFNRPLNLNNVALIEEKMRIKGYRIGEPIQVIKAEKSAENGIMSLIDLNGQPIQIEKYKNFYLVLDGSHRTHAVSLFNDYLTAQGKEIIDVPAIEIELVKNESITEYTNEINCTKKEWSPVDYLNGASSLYPHEMLLQRFNQIVKTDSNPKGISLSTLNLIYCNGKGLSKSDLEKLCSGVTQKGTRTKQNIIPAHNIDVGDQFLQICKEKGFKEEEIAKRYLIKEFNDLRNSKDVEFAQNVFKCITPDDVSMMTNENGKLNEQKVIDHFKVLVSRLSNT